MTRQSTSLEILGVDWDHPVPSTFEESRGKGHTFVARAAVAWPAEEAFRKIAGDDPRPILVLRECDQCKGTEHALFSRRLNNEKTQLLLRWFHCVKLPPEVAKTNHPFHNVFENKAGWMPHLFIASADGSNRVLFTGAQPQTVLQRELTKLIDASYDKKPEPAMKSMLGFLSKFDMYDLRESELLQMVDAAREEHGPESSAVKKLQEKLAKVRKDKAAAMKSAKAVSDLKLRVVTSDPRPGQEAAGGIL